MKFGTRRELAVELAMLLAVAAFACAVRLVYLEPIEIGSDAYQRWHFARQWFHDLNFREVTWDHHKSRLGVIVPMVVGQALFGRGPVVYSGVAIAGAAFTAMAAYSIGRAVYGRAVGLVAVVIWVLAPDMVRAGSQVTPEAWAGLFATLSLLVLLGRERAERRELTWTAAASALLFFAYLAKETAPIFVPGALVACWLLTRRLRDVLVFAVVQAVLLAIESLFYVVTSPYATRAELIRSSLASSEGAPAYVNGFSGFFERYTMLPGSYQLLLGAAAVAALVLPLVTRDRRAFAVIAYPLSFYFFSTFLIKSFTPLEVWVRFLPRYLDAGTPFAAVLVPLGVAHVVAALGRLSARGLSRWPAPERWLEATREPRARAAVLLARSLPVWAPLGLAAIAWSLYRRYPPGDDHPLYMMPRAAHVLSDAYRRGLPIRAVGAEKFRWRVVGAGLCFYIDDDLLVENGKLPEFDELVSKKREGIVRGKRRRVPKRCEVRLFTERGHFGFEPHEPLPADCDE